MIINENGKKILRLGLQKALISTVAGILIATITGISIGFKLAFNDHITLGNLVLKVDKIEQSINIDFVKKETLAQEQKIEEEKFKSIDNNLNNMNKNMDTMNGNIQLILKSLIKE